MDCSSAFGAAWPNQPQLVRGLSAAKILPSGGRIQRGSDFWIRKPVTLRRIAPTLGLFVLSPLVAEFLLGNVAIDAIPIGLVMAPMYGGGAVLIREVARRSGKGWLTIFLLALAYALIEEGIVCQTLFNPSYFGFDLLREGHIPALGMGAWWTLFVLALHTIWSISAPIAIIEALVPERATVPWLGWPGLAVMSVLYVLGSAFIFWGTYQQERFMATTAQFLGVAACVIALIAAAFTVRQRSTPNDRAVPRPWHVGAFSLLTASTFMALRYVLADWPIVFAYFLLFGLVAVMVIRWSERVGWDAPTGWRWREGRCRPMPGIPSPRNR
jgi:hypothetical protein